MKLAILNCLHYTARVGRFNNREITHWLASSYFGLLFFLKKFLWKVLQCSPAWPQMLSPASNSQALGSQRFTRPKKLPFYVGFRWRITPTETSQLTIVGSLSNPDFSEQIDSLL